MKKVCTLLLLFTMSTSSAQTLTPDSVLINLLKGEKGDPGPIGPEGPQGLPGKDGRDATGSAVDTNGFIRNVATWDDLQKAFQAVDAGIVRTIVIQKDLYATYTIQLPQLYISDVEVQGNGAMIKKQSPYQVDLLFSRSFKDLTTAHKFIDFKMIWNRVHFYGQNYGTGIHYSTSYQSAFEYCTFRQFNIAIDLRWAMSTTFWKCTWIENYIGVNNDYDRFTGGNNTSSQSNHTSFFDCKFRTKVGNFAAIKSNGCSGLLLDHCILEGGDKASKDTAADYGVYFDDNGSPVVKDVAVKLTHIEFIPRIAALYIRMKDGIALFEGFYAQKAGTLVQFITSGYAEMIVGYSRFIHPAAKFESIGGGARWTFMNMSPDFNACDDKWWKGSKPIHSAELRRDAAGQAFVIRINCKQVQTSTQ